MSPLDVVPWGMIAFAAPTPTPVPATAVVWIPDWLLIVVDIAPVITLLVAVAAIIPAWVAIYRNGKSNRQGRWWSEAQWALDASFGQDVARKQAGIRLLKILATEKWLGEEELRVLDAAWQRPIEEAGERRTIIAAESKEPGTAAGTPSGTAHETERPQEADHQVQVEAAQLKMILDARLNRKTAPWIKDLAKG